MQSHNFHQQRKVGQNHNYLFQIHRLPGNCQHTLKCGFGKLWHFVLYDLLLPCHSLWFVANIYLHTKLCWTGQEGMGTKFPPDPQKRCRTLSQNRDFRFQNISRYTSETKLFALNISAWSRRCRELSRNWFFIVIIWYTLPEVLYIIKSINQVFLHMRPD